MSMTVVAVVSEIESNTLTFPAFSPTKTRPSAGEADDGGQVEPGEGRLLFELGIRHRRDGAIDGASRRAAYGLVLSVSASEAGQQVD